ncbi:probable very-long-chain enoyl-CoA reductase art-1 [Aethina tumida]|uniref:probable very-long-chain enoyl-CoA reductase art-1 n=1 Tax=Aethina tumida TaxID=116153 RepID=UPI00096AECF1|nr:probable very-long-chain enoyl-CoA reductase art-1 [Aethina tumida]
MFNLQVYDIKRNHLGEISVEATSRVRSIKWKIAELTNLSVHRQALKATRNGIDLKDSLTTVQANLMENKKIFVKDLGPQVKMSTLFNYQHAGSLYIFACVILKPDIIFHNWDSSTSLTLSTLVALICWSLHFIKKMWETAFLYKFFSKTIHIKYLFAYCPYLWILTFYVAYHISHPYYTPPPVLVQLVGFLVFLTGEVGNLSIHFLQRDFRRSRKNIREVPNPNENPFTKLYHVVSSPNYTYEFITWVGFAVMTSCLPAGIFAALRLWQMANWALAKQRKLRRILPKYPKNRKAILPYIL